MFTRRPWLFPISVAAALLFVAILASAQNISTAQLNGVVRDPQGAVVPNGSVTISDASKGFSRSATTDGQGNFRLLLLPPGTYTVTADSPGFSRLVEQNLVLTTGQEAELSLTLTVGGSETVTVSSGADIIETQRSSQSTTVDQLRITNLPTNGRNYINFTLTNSQIARDAAPSVGAIPTSGLNFGGARARSNSINIDGADAGDYISGGTRATVSQDAVQEFQIITNGFDAEYGRASGGVVNIVTKSGTNQTHASRLRLSPQQIHSGDKPIFNGLPACLHPRPGGIHSWRRDRPQQDLLLLGAELTRRQETGFSVIGRSDFGLTNIDVSRFYRAPAGALIVQGTAEQSAFLASVPATTQAYSSTSPLSAPAPASLRRERILHFSREPSARATSLPLVTRHPLPSSR